MVEVEGGGQVHPLPHGQQLAPVLVGGEGLRVAAVEPPAERDQAQLPVDVDQLQQGPHAVAVGVAGQHPGQPDRVVPVVRVGGGGVGQRAVHVQLEPAHHGGARGGAEGAQRPHPAGRPGAGLPVVVAGDRRVDLPGLHRVAAAPVGAVRHPHGGAAVDQLDLGAGTALVAFQGGVAGHRVVEVVRGDQVRAQRRVDVGRDAPIRLRRWRAGAGQCADRQEGDGRSSGPGHGCHLVSRHAGCRSRKRLRKRLRTLGFDRMPLATDRVA